jgi:hypothetical protein
MQGSPKKKENKYIVERVKNLLSILVVVVIVKKKKSI